MQAKANRIISLQEKVLQMHNTSFISNNVTSHPIYLVLLSFIILTFNFKTKGHRSILGYYFQGNALHQ